MTTADRVTFFKMASGQMARKYGAIATHMPKPFADQTGSGLHVHFHLADAKTGKNVFLDETDATGWAFADGLSLSGGRDRPRTGRCAVTGPTVNCYKRLKLGQGLYSTRSGFGLDAGVCRLRRQQPHAMIRVAGPGHCEDRTVLGRMQSVPGPGGHVVSRTGRHPAPTRSRAAERRQHVRALT